MEYTQWVYMDKRIIIIEPDGLIPCCNGIYSMRAFIYMDKRIIIIEDLILVVMEYSQWEW